MSLGLLIINNTLKLCLSQILVLFFQFYNNFEFKSSRRTTGIQLEMRSFPKFYREILPLELRPFLKILQISIVSGSV